MYGCALAIKMVEQRRFRRPSSLLFVRFFVGFPTRNVTVFPPTFRCVFASRARRLSFASPSWRFYPRQHFSSRSAVFARDATLRGHHTQPRARARSLVFPRENLSITYRGFVPTVIITITAFLFHTCTTRLRSKPRRPRI